MDMSCRIARKQIMFSFVYDVNMWLCAKPV